MKKNLLNFPVVIYSKLENYNETLSKARCRIFYKYGNRNGTYITDSFAKELINGLHYVPVKAIYNKEDKDFTDHGEKRDEGRIYAIVPESNNFAWEKHLDEDGVEREYACTDILVFTALYEEAKDIIGKSQSMELFEPSVKYHFEFIKGAKYAVFDKGCFLGLQVLGDNVEPCFEGSSFYTLQGSIEQIIDKIKEYTLSYQEKGGQTEMPKINFKLSDDEKFDALWSLLNTEYTEENDWVVTHGIVSIYDEYAVVRSYGTREYERVYYTKDDEKDSVVINSREKCYIMDVSEKEKATIETLQQLNGGTYELVNEALTDAQENSQKVLDFGIKIEELDGLVSTLTTERDNSAAAAEDKISTLNNELDTLKQYKLQIEKDQKDNVLSEYADHLSKEVLEGYREKLNEYSALELDKELAYELKKTNVSLFKKVEGGYIPKDNPKSGIEEILSKYTK